MSIYIDADAFVRWEKGEFDLPAWLLSRPEEWASLRRAGRAYVERERNWATSVARYEGVYAAARGLDPGPNQPPK